MVPNKVVLKFRWQNVFGVWKPNLIVLVVVAIVNLLYTLLVYNEFRTSFIFWGTMVGFGLQYFIAILITIQYIVESINYSFEIDEHFIYVKNREMDKRITISDISHITIYQSNDLFDENNISLALFDGFEFAQIKLKKGEDYIITNFHTPIVQDIFFNFKGKKNIKRKKRPICMI